MFWVSVLRFVGVMVELGTGFLCDAYSGDSVRDANTEETSKHIRKTKCSLSVEIRWAGLGKRFNSTSPVANRTSYEYPTGVTGLL